jgi:hypothetical protein
MGPSVVGCDWSPVSSNKARGYLLLSNFVSTIEPHCGRGVQPGGIYAYVVHREPTPGGPGSGWRRGRKRFLCQLAAAPALALILYIYFVPPTPWLVERRRRRTYPPAVARAQCGRAAAGSAALSLRCAASTSANVYTGYA